MRKSFLFNYISYLCFIFLSCVLASKTCALAFPEKPAFIIDTDMGIDDAIAILYLLNDSTLTVKAITIESDGNAHCRPAFANLKGLLSLSHKEDIPVACGRTTPLEGQHRFPEHILATCDNLAKSLLKQPHAALPLLNAKDLLLKTLRAAKKPLKIVALGPLTTIAQVLDQEPQLKNKISMIYLMGGAVRVAGNVHEVEPSNPNRVAEWNIYIDPLAAKKVFHAGVPLTLIPLDVSNQALMDLDFYKKLKASQQSPAARFVYALLKKNKQMIDEKAWYFWDPLAAAVAVDESLVGMENLKLTVDLAPENKSGRTRLDALKGTPLRVCTSLQFAAFKTRLLQGLNKR